MAQPWTDEDAATLARMHGEGASLTSIAKHLGRHAGTVSKKAKAAGLSFDRAPVAAANEARAVDARARRQRIVENQHRITELIQGHLIKGEEGKGWDTLVRAAGGAEFSDSLPYVPARDRKDVLSALNSSSTIIARLDDQHTDHDDAKSVITDLVQGLAEDYQRRHP